MHFKQYPSTPDMMFISVQIHIQFERFVIFSIIHGISSPEGRFGAGFLRLFGKPVSHASAKRDTATDNPEFQHCETTTNSHTCRITHIMRREGGLKIDI